MNRNAMAGSATKLPSPAINLGNKANDDDTHEDDPSRHQGRKRSFPHERGIWASYVSVDFDDVDGFQEIREVWQKFLKFATLEFVPVCSLHLSLTKTFIIRHHNIASFVANLQEQVAMHEPFRLEFDRPEVYVNDLRTRTFVGVRVAEASFGPLDSLVNSLDECMQQYKLPLYYSDRSYHVSILWCSGDQREEIRRTLSVLADTFKCIYRQEYREMSQKIRKLVFKSGNKLFELGLA